MSDYQRINANYVEIGEDTGPQPSLKGALGQTLNVNASLVSKDLSPIISFVEPVAPATLGTINFHNQNILNFTGGGGGGSGDASLAGGANLANPQEFTGFNRFDNDVQLKDHLLFSDDGVIEKGKISCAANEMKIQTDTATDIISMKLGNAGSTNTLELKQDPSATTQNGLFLRQVATGSTLDKVLTDSTQDLGVIVDAVEVSPNTFTAANTFTTQTTTTGITNTGGLTNSNGMVNTGGMTSDVLTCQGLLSTQSINSTSSITSGGITNSSGLSNTGGVVTDVMTCQGLLSTQSINSTSSITSGGITNSSGLSNTGGLTSDTLTCQGLLTTQTLNATQNITGNQLLSNGDITCGVGSNFIVGSAQIASGNLSDVSSLLNTSGTQQVKTGNLVVGQITSSTGVLNFDTTGGANIQNDTTNNVLLTSTTNATDRITWRLGTSGNDNLRLRYDANGGGAGVPRYFLEMLDPATGPSSYFQLSGNSSYDIAGIIALLNNSSLTFDATTTTTFNGQINYPQPTFTTFTSAGYFVGAPTTFIDVTGISRFPLGILTETYGTTSKITLRGCCQLRTGGLIAANTTIASLPVAVRPSVDVVVSVQGQSGSEQGRVDFLSNGNVQFIGPDATFTQINLSQISYFLV